MFGALFLTEAVLLALNAFSPYWTWNLALESNVPAFYQSGVLGAIALSLWSIDGLASFWRRRATLRVHQAPWWLATGVIFLYLAIDEAAEVHERLAPKA